jgi:predicted acyltransferase
LRYPGVLFRIALCYLLASMIMMRTGLIGRIAWTLLLLSVYNFIITYFGPLGWYLFEDGMGRRVDSPLDTPFRGELHDFIDQVVFGRHLYSRMPDPEGLLSTLPAIATTLCGVLTGMWLLTKRSMQQKASIMVLAGLFLILVGLGMDLFFPINKKIWSSSYVVFSAGWAAAILALCVWVIDIMGYKRMAHPFVVYGMNAIFVFFMSGIAAKMLAITKWANDDGKTMSLKGWLNQTLVKSWTTDPKFSSLMFAIFTVTFWWFICWLLYKRRIFIKV